MAGDLWTDHPRSKTFYKDQIPVLCIFRRNPLAKRDFDSDFIRRYWNALGFAAEPYWLALYLVSSVRRRRVSGGGFRC